MPQIILFWQIYRLGQNALHRLLQLLTFFVGNHKTEVTREKGNTSQNMEQWTHRY